MSPLPMDRMFEATRLTRAGRLAEATALLRGTPGGRSQPGARPVMLADGLIDLLPQGDSSWTVPPQPDPAPPPPGRAAPAPLRGRMAALYDRLGTIEALGGNAATPGRKAAPPVPAGAEWAEHVHASASGKRSYKLYVPAAGAGRKRALVVMLHGCTQDPDDFAAGTKMNLIAEEQGFLVAYPRQPQSANVAKCWNWFSPSDQERDGGEPELIAGITRRIIRDHDVDPDRVYIAGLSAGGAAAAIMGARYPDLYAAIGVHSGLACGAARDMPSALAAMRGGATGQRRLRGPDRPVRTIVFHGDRDQTVSPVNGDQVAAQFKAAAGPLEAEVMRGEVPGGPAYTRTVHRGAKGEPLLEQWVVHGAGHAWFGGSGSGTYTDPAGPDASREMIRFFLAGP